MDPIDCSAQPLDVAFHHEQEFLMAAALVDGTVEVHNFTPNQGGTGDDDDSESDTIVSSISVHTQLVPGKDKKQHVASCRAVRWSLDGTRLYTGGSAGDICWLDAQAACKLSSSTKPLGRLHSHSDKISPINVLHQLPTSAPTGPMLVSGDEQGCVRIWDERLVGNPSNGGSLKKSGTPKGCVLSWEQHTDYISGFDHSEDGLTLLASSADSTLGIYDLRKATTKGQHNEPNYRVSDDMEDELLSITVMKHGKKVVCGTQEGVLAVWSWGTWGDMSDRFPGHPASIDALLKVDEDTILTGCSDGLLRLVQIQPDKLVGVLGDHGGFPIEKLHFNANRSHVGSVSHDTLVRLWDVRMLQDDFQMDEEDEKVGSLAAMQVPPSLGVAKTAGQAAEHESDDDWEDMDEEMNDMSDEEDSDDSDDSDDDVKQATTNDKRAGRMKSDNDKFFDDL